MAMISRADVAQRRIEQLTDRPLADHGHVEIEQVGKFFQGKQDCAQRLGQQGMVVAGARVERNCPLLADAEPFEQAFLVDRHAKHALAGAESRTVGIDHGADHLVQGMAHHGRVLRVVGLEVQQVRTAQAAQFRLEDDLGFAFGRPAGEFRFRNVNQPDLAGRVDFTCKQGRFLSEESKL